MSKEEVWAEATYETGSQLAVQGLVLKMKLACPFADVSRAPVAKGLCLYCSFGRNQSG